MSSFAPFEVFIKVIPARDGDNKWTYIRELQKLATRAYAALIDISEPPAISFASPGGGQKDGGGVMSNYVAGMMAKPQMGDFPAQLTIAGNYEIDDGEIVQQYESTTVICHNSVYTGSQKNTSLPTTALDSVADDLRTAINSALTGVSDDTGSDIKVYKLIICGVVYGEGGYHFPS